MAWHILFSVSGVGSPRWKMVQRRLIGIWALILGSIFLIVGGIAVLAPRLYDPVASRLDGLIPVAIGALVIALGVYMCRQQSFRPDLGDIHPMLGKSEGYNDQYIAEHRLAKRTWWTGDPLPPSDQTRDG
jgi:hypothetical protein